MITHAENVKLFALDETGSSLNLTRMWECSNSNAKNIIGNLVGKEKE